MDLSKYIKITTSPKKEAKQKEIKPKEEMQENIKRSPSSALTFPQIIGIVLLLTGFALIAIAIMTW